MSVFDLLQTVGGKLGILEAQQKSASGEPQKIVTRTVTLDELKSEIDAEDVRALADLPAEFTIAFEKIFEAAGVTPPAQGWSLSRLKDALRSDRFKNREFAAAQKDLLDLLSADRVAAEDLVKEAVAQDQALDAFETFVRRKVDGHIATAARRVAEIDARIAALNAERAGLKERTQIEQDKLRDWCKRKRAHERELASAVGYLTERPVISTDDNIP
jgi:hypothetical protein